MNPSVSLPEDSGEIRDSLESFAATFLHRFIKGKGGFGDLVVAIAFVTALYIILLPNLNISNLDIKSLTLHDWLLLVSLSSSTIFLAIFLIRVISRWIIKGWDWVAGIRSRVYSRGEALLISEEEEGRNVGKAVDIPIRLREFYEVGFTVEIQRFRRHWRAGLKLRHQNEREGRYIFHAHVDEDSPDVLRVRGNYALGDVTVKDERREVEGVSRDSFEIKVTNENGFVRSYINDNEVFGFEVDESVIARVSLHAWADGKPYKILFKNVKVRYK